jgi:hypothetical protein
MHVTYTKRILCLANSRKHAGRCIAGKEVVPDAHRAWVRPVSARPAGEISEEERRFENGRDPRVLDIIDVPMLAGAPHLYQTENHIIDPSYYWAKVGEASWDDLAQFLDSPTTLWTNGDSTYNGLNDRVKLEVASRLRDSLFLIAPESLMILVQVEGAAFGNPRRKVRAQFRYNGVNYILAVIDPMAERAFLAKEDGEYPVRDAYLCVSLGEAHTDGNCYKLVATLITKQPL